jgi:hypothetical protein
VEEAKTLSTLGHSSAFGGRRRTFVSARSRLFSRRLRFDAFVGLTARRGFGAVATDSNIARNLKRPAYSWKFLDNGAIRVESPIPPKEVKLWQGHNPNARDFRLEEVGPIYVSSPVKEIEPGIYVGKIDAPKEGFTAFFVELTYDIGSHRPLKVTTDVRVLPEVLPFKGIAPTQKLGGAKLLEAEIRRREQEKAKKNQ